MRRHRTGSVRVVARLLGVVVVPAIADTASDCSQTCAVNSHQSTGFAGNVTVTDLWVHINDRTLTCTLSAGQQVSNVSAHILS